MPDTVSVALGDLAGQVEEGLLAFAVGAGLKVVQSMMDHEVEVLAGPKGRHDPDRVAVRHGSDDGLVTLGGRQVPISRPRVRSADRTSEVALSTYDCFASTEREPAPCRWALIRGLLEVGPTQHRFGLAPRR